MPYHECMTETLLQALHAAADACRRCEGQPRSPDHSDADLVRKWLRDLGDTISNAASDASNQCGTFDAVVDVADSVDPDGIASGAAAEKG